MGLLLQCATGTQYLLRSENLVGRGPGSYPRVDDPLVSTAHAQIRWHTNYWEIHDLDSRNGTFVDGVRLGTGERRGLSPAAKLAFGNTDEVFELADINPPVAHAWNQAGRLQRPHSPNMLVLPGPDTPLWLIFERHGEWFAESTDGDQTPIADGTSLPIGNDIWTLHLPEIVEPTRRKGQVALRLHNLGLRFAVNLDEESIALTLLHPPNPIEMRQRVHFEMLLRLAEARVADHKAGIAAEEAGWLYVPDLLKRLDIADEPQGRNLLHQHIFQARHQLARAGVEGAVGIVERRQTVVIEKKKYRVGQIRLGVARIDIVYPGRAGKPAAPNGFASTGRDDGAA